MPFGSSMPMTIETVEDEDWWGEDLDGTARTNTALLEVDLSETTSSGRLSFVDCTFRGVEFHRAKHAGASFLNCSFSRCDFFGASFRDCKFTGSSFANCGFDRLDVRVQTPALLDPDRVGHGGDEALQTMRVHADLL